MIRVRLADPDRTPLATAEARAELARLTADPRPTFLGWSRRTAVAIAAAVTLVGVALGAMIPSPCVIVEHGPTGPEPDATFARTVEVCGDVMTVTTWVVTTGEVDAVEVIR